MVTEEGNKRREASKAKYGPVLEEIFVDIDVDKSGYASIDEMWLVYRFFLFRFRKWIFVRSHNAILFSSCI